jgi:hypothetical protein
LVEINYFSQSHHRHFRSGKCLRQRCYNRESVPRVEKCFLSRRPYRQNTADGPEDVETRVAIDLPHRN